MEVEYDCVNPYPQWEFWIKASVDKIGTGNCGIFINAKNEKEARKYFKELVKIIKNEELVESD